MQAVKTRGQGHFYVEAGIWGMLKSPQTPEAWHRALLLPSTYTVEQVERLVHPDAHYDRFCLTLSSESIPEHAANIQLDLYFCQNTDTLNENTQRTTARLTKIEIRQWDGNHWQKIAEDIMTDETPTKETVILHAAGAIPGIPGEHGAGRYEVDWEARTATPVVDEVAPEPEQPQGDQEATQPLQTNTQA